MTKRVQEVNLGKVTEKMTAAVSMPMAAQFIQVMAKGDEVLLYVLDDDRWTSCVERVVEFVHGYGPVSKGSEYIGSVAVLNRFGEYDSYHAFECRL